MENEFIHSVIYQPESDGGFNISVPIPTSYMYHQAFEMCLAKIQTVKNLTDLGKPAEAVDHGVMLQGHLIRVGISIQRRGLR